jgi:DNA repair exonuclease SbcCD ATPase subunit
MKNIKRIEVKDGHYFITSNVGESEEITKKFSHDAFMEMYNTLNSARLSGKGVIESDKEYIDAAKEVKKLQEEVEILKDSLDVSDKRVEAVLKESKRDIALEDRVYKFERKLAKAVNRELDSYRQSINILDTTLAKITDDNGVLEKITENALDKLSNVESVLAGMNDLNNATLERIRERNTAIEKRLIEIDSIEEAVSRKQDEIKAMVDKANADFDKFKKQADSFFDQVEGKKKEIADYNAKISEFVKQEVTDSVAKVEDKYSEYLKAYEAREQMFKALQDYELKKITIANSTSDRLEKEEKLLEKTRKRTDALLKQVEKEVKSVAGVDKKFKKQVANEIKRILGSVEYTTNDVTDIVNTITKLLQKYETEGRESIRKNKKQAVEKTGIALSISKAIQAIKNRIS